jgi:tRNA (cytidine/uridine-2'-O-)-methyltransferase
MNILLHEPEIPYNTGNIGRTCVASGTALHLIKPLGFFIDEKSVKRAGLDYWDQLELYIYEDFDDFIAKNPNATIYMATTKAKKTYAEVAYEKDSFIMFGKESAGIPEDILVKYPDTSIRIPMEPNIRSLNLSNAVAIVLYESLRQQNFSHMQLEGQLRDYKW